jgi:hypothetical protein
LRNGFVRGGWHSKGFVVKHALLYISNLVQEVAQNIVKLFVDKLLGPFDANDKCYESNSTVLGCMESQIVNNCTRLI